MGDGCKQNTYTGTGMSLALKTIGHLGDFNVLLITF